MKMFVVLSLAQELSVKL